MEITATIASVLPMVSGTSSRGEWKKATVVVKFLDGQYEQHLALDNLRNADAFAALQAGQTMKFYFNVTSRENNGKWYTSATCWKWEPVAGQQQPQPQYAQQSQPQGFNIPPSSPQPTSDLPF